MEKKNIHWEAIFSFKPILLTILGVFFGAIALKGFLIPNHFLDGGVTGISILLTDIVDIHISYLLVVFNIPFVIIGYKKISKTFGVHAAFAVLLMATMLFFIEMPVVTNDQVLIAIFGGFLIGLGIGLVIRAGGVIDGLEVIASYTHKKSSFSTGEIILAFNSIIILAVAYEYGIETGMYSILTYYAAMKTSNYVVDGFEAYTAINIISEKQEEIKSILVNDLGKGITIYKGERGHLPGSFNQYHQSDIIKTIVSRLEIYRIKKEIRKIDPKAFLFVENIKEVSGGILKYKRTENF